MKLLVFIALLAVAAASFPRPIEHSSNRANAIRQHRVNVRALHVGASAGTAPYYGVPGTTIKGVHNGYGYHGVKHVAYKGHHHSLRLVQVAGPTPADQPQNINVQAPGPTPADQPENPNVQAPGPDEHETNKINAERQHKNNVRALHHGASAGTATYYGVPGTSVKGVHNDHPYYGHGYGYHGPYNGPYFGGYHHGYGHHHAYFKHGHHAHHKAGHHQYTVKLVQAPGPTPADQPQNSNVQAPGPTPADQPENTNVQAAGPSEVVTNRINAERQHKNNVRALHYGASAGTAPYYGIAGTSVKAVHNHGHYYSHGFRYHGAYSPIYHGHHKVNPSRY